LILNKIKLKILYIIFRHFSRGFCEFTDFSIESKEKDTPRLDVLKNRLAKSFVLPFFFTIFCLQNQENVIQ